MKRRGIFLVWAFTCAWALGQECTPQWEYLLSTDPSFPKEIAGDTNAAYGSFSYWGDGDLKLVFRGRFPRARFLSVESNSTRWGFPVEAIFDHAIEPDAGSVNPFRPGTPLDATARSYTLEVVPEGSDVSGANVLHVRKGQLQQSLLFRIYSPNEGVVVGAEDFPRVFAFDSAGRERTCPANAPIRMTLDLPQFLTLPILRKPKFGFMDIKVPWGPNSAIPAYVGAGERMRSGSDVALIRFKAPTHVETRPGAGNFSDEGEVRYWSFCSGNLVKLMTLNCLPDYLARPDGNGFVTVVFGRGEDVRRETERRGYSFLEDTREASQTVAEFVYRNILPREDFKAVLYQGEYRPRGTLCDRSGFLAGECD